MSVGGGVYGMVTKHSPLRAIVSLPLRVLLLVLVLLSALPALMIMVRGDLQQARRELLSAEDGSLTLVKTLALQQERLTDNALQLLTTLSRLPDMKTGSAGTLGPLLAELINQNSLFANIAVADKEGMVYVSALSHPPYSVKDRRYFQDTLRSKRFTAGEYAVSRSAMRPAFHFAYPVLAGDEVRAVLIAVISASAYAETLKTSRLPAGSRLEVIDRNGTLVFDGSEGSDSRSGTKVLQPDGPELMSPIHEGVYRIERDSEQYFVAFTGLSLEAGKRPYLYIRASVPMSQALAQSRDTLREKALLFLLAVLLALLLAWELGDLLIRRRVRALLHASARLAKGDLSARASGEVQGGELGDLARSLDRTAESLQVRESDRAAALRSLKESDDRYRALFNTMLNGFAYHEIVCDAAGRPVDYRFLEVNPAFERQTGLRAAEVVGKRAREILPRLEEHWIHRYGKVALTGEPLFFEDYSQDLGRYFDTYAYRPRPGTFAVVFTDVTDRRRAQEDLTAEKERLAVTLASIVDGVIATDSQGLVRLMNPAAETMTGWLSREAEGTPLDVVYATSPHNEAPSRTSPADAILAATGAGGSRDVAILHQRPGTQITIADTATPLRSQDGRVQGVVVVFRDISTARKMQEELQRSSKLESLGLLAGGIAHDFNNLLTAVSGNIALAQESLRSNGAVALYLEGVQDAVFRAQDLTQQLLTFSKGGAPIKRLINLAELVHSSAEFVLRGSPHVVEFRISEDTWPAQVDSGQISQVLNNLVINASQAMQDVSGKIVIEAQNLQRTAPSGGELPYVHISVTDTGCGICETDLPRIFDPFFSTKPHGSGLGLSSAFSIVKAHGGWIDVHSEVGAGSTFSIYLPAMPGVEVPAVTHTKGGSMGRTRRVLVMDDEPILRDLIVEMIGSLGHEAQAASEGQQAIDMYQRALANGQPFDVVILDLTVKGGLGGKEVIPLLKQVDPKVRAIASSGYSTDAVMAEYESFGFAGRLTKPYRLEELRAVISS